MRTRTLTGALAAALAVTLGATLGLTAGADAATSDRKADTSPTAAQSALADARAALTGGVARPSRDATLLLRDLFTQRTALTGADRLAADRLLARPTDPGDEDYLGVADEVACGTYVCVHWTEDATTGEEVAATDTDPANGTPDYVDAVLATMNDVHSTYVAAGYKAPLPDDGLGGNNKPDVYLANIGDQGLYGYCTSDENPPPGWYSVWAYCVLDNDYSPAEFPSNTPLENMQVTAAHEYYHAVQFAYDAFEDGWFMEATATWVEDEVFDDVDDNLFYLEDGPLGAPQISLDKFVDLHQYGDWIFFRYLTEAMPIEDGGLPVLVRDFWERADSTNGESNDYYSLQAVKSVLAAQGLKLRKVFAAFAADNNHPASTYDEGEANNYPTPPKAFALAQLTPGSPGTPWRSKKLDHMASATGAFTPSSQMTQNDWVLTVKVDMGNKKTGSEARVIVYGPSGPQTYSISLNRKGNGSRTVPFDYDQVAAVEAVLVNASDKLTCWQGKPFACQGAPKHDNVKELLKATAHR